MMDMMDMKMPKNSKKELMDNMIQPTEEQQQPEYPYGLEISLNEESIKKFPGLLDKAKMGQSINGQIKAYVKSMSQDKVRDGSMSRHMTLQIEKMGLMHDDDYEEAFDEAAKKRG